MISNEDLLDLLPAHSSEVLRDLMCIMTYEQAIERIQRAIDTDLVMLGPDAMLVPHDGEFYYA